LPRDGRILDVGAGDGWTVMHLRKIGYRDVFGIEVDQALISPAVRPGNVLSLEGWEGQDAILGFNILHHLASTGEISDALGEILRVLTAGGVFVSVEPIGPILWRTELALASVLAPISRTAKAVRDLVRAELPQMDRWHAVRSMRDEKFERVWRTRYVYQDVGVWKKPE
jgi:SAM-dependent methyltransferase